MATPALRTLGFPRRLRLGMLLLGMLLLGTAWADEPEPAESPAVDGKPALIEAATDLEGHKGLVRSLDFDPSGERLVTGGADRSLRIWDGSTGKQLASVILPRGG